MNTCFLARSLQLVIATISPICGTQSHAANLSVTLDPGDATTPDSTYLGSGSTITTVTHNQTQVTITVAGREYGNSAVAGSSRWGLTVGPVPARPAEDGFVVSGGFSPVTPGSTQNSAGTAASYVSISLGNVQPNTLFQNVSVEFRGLTTTDTTNAWGAASAGGFANWSVATLSNNGKDLTLDLADFTWTGAGPVEIRLYGLTGLSDGAFDSLRVKASLTNILPVPEPHAAFVFGTFLGVIGARRRRVC